MRIALNSLRTLAFRILLVGLGQLLTILTARWLGPQGNGLFTFATYNGTLATALMNGGMVAIAHDISHRGSDTRSAAANAVSLSLVVGLIPAVIALALAPWLIGHDWWWVLPVALAQPAVLMSAALVGVFLGVDDIKRLNYAYVGPWAATLALFLGMTLAFGRTVHVALFAWAMGQTLAALYSLLLARTHWAPFALQAISLRRQRWLVAFGMQAGLANLVSFLNYRMDAYMVEFYRGEQQLGIYAVGVRVAEGLWFFSTAIWMAAYAQIGALSEEESARLTARGMRHAMFIIGLLAIALMLIAEPLLTILFGTAYRGAVTPFRWLVPGIAFYGLASILSAYYTNRLAKPHIPLAIASLSMLLNLASCTVLIPAFGLAGAALASTLGYTVAIAVGVLAFRRTTRLGLREIVLVNGEDLLDYVRFARRLRDILRPAAPVSPAG